MSNTLAADHKSLSSREKSRQPLWKPSAPRVAHATRDLKTVFHRKPALMHASMLCLGDHGVFKV